MIWADFSASPDEDQVWKGKESRKMAAPALRLHNWAPSRAPGSPGSRQFPGDRGGGGPERPAETQRLLGSQAPLVRRERGLGERNDENGTPGVRLHFIALKEKGKIGPGVKKMKKGEERKRKEQNALQPKATRKLV